MRVRSQFQWIPRALLVGFVYAFIGVAFAIPHSHVHAWRLAAWVVSAAVYAGHIVLERRRPSWTHAAVAVHVAVAAALGAFGLAAGANVHALLVPSQPRLTVLLLIALVAWPAITAVPAFLVAFATSWLLSRDAVPRNRDARGI